MKKLLIIISILNIFLLTSCGGGTGGNSTNNTGTEESSTNDTGTEENKCLLSDFNIQENSTIRINCLLDLEGEAVSIPADVTFEFDGGDIFNGTLYFSSTGQIAGELLNSDLTIEGEHVALISETFNFDKSRWRITEGDVSDEIARNNRDILEGLFLFVKNLNASTFVIDELDAYFKVDGYLNEAVPTNQGINIPSDFNLVMSDNTHFRMQPNGHFRASLLSIYNESNITVSGGFLHGDRETHDYNSGFVDSDGSVGPSNEWVHTMVIKGGQDIIIDDVTFLEATGDGISISGINHFFDEDYIKSTEVTIKNSEFYRARRTNIVITNGDEITIEGNLIIDGGIDMDNSTGTAPSSNLNIEASRSYDDENNLIEYERVNNVYIRGNIQKVNDKEANPNSGQFQISHANGPIIIENNEMINTGVSFFTVHGIEIINNIFTEGGISAGSAGNFGREDVVYGNVVSGNSVITSGTALNIAGNGVTVTNNLFEGKVAVAFGAGATTEEDGASNIVFTDNTVIGSSRGITTNNTMHNVLIDNNEIDLTDTAAFSAVIVNRWNEDNTEEANFVFSNNTITGEKEGSENGAPPFLFFGNSATINNNVMGELQFSSGNNVNVLENTIEAPTGQSGISINAEITNTSFNSNNVVIYTSQTPLSIECVKIKEGVTLPTSTTFTNESCTEK
jgi:hypothetical protein